MSNKEPAFPLNELNQTTGDICAQHFGLTARDYFAARAMQIALAGATLPGLMEREPETMEVIGKLADAMYVIADAMMAARERGER